MNPILLAAALWLPGPVDEGIDTTDSATRDAIRRGMAYLLSIQNDDGSFGGVKNATYTSGFANVATYHCWQVGTTGLCAQALVELGGDDESMDAANRALDYLAANAQLVRPAEWDVDNNWGLIFGLHALAVALREPGFATDERRDTLTTAAEQMLAGLKRYQSARGGWGYYADPDAAWRPDWATSFTTANGVLALLEAKAAGLDVDGKVLGAAIKAVRRARLPNGAYEYDVAAYPRHLRMESINQVKGSLGRIQVCNYALHRAGVELPEDAIAEGVDQFFRHHAFLDVARNKPIPHEAYYANAAYFYLYGHYYAAHTIGLMEGPPREAAMRRLRAEVMKCQQDDGSMWDFWIASNTKAYGTAFGVMTLARTLR